MKTLILSLALFMGASASAHLEGAPTKDVVLTPETVFVPDSFPAAQEPFAVVNGSFPNSCYHWKYAVVTHRSGYEHEMIVLAEVEQKRMCLMVVRPYAQQVQLGNLPTGHHVLRVINGDGTFSDHHFLVEGPNAGV